MFSGGLPLVRDRYNTEQLGLLTLRCKAMSRWGFCWHPSASLEFSPSEKIFLIPINIV